MLVHQHPYPPFVHSSTEKLIVGTLPPPRFSTGELFDEDVDFCYGSKYGLLWPIMERIFETELIYENTAAAIQQREKLLVENNIGICDLVESCEREKNDASDVGMLNIETRNIFGVLECFPKITKLFLMGGKSKNGPEYLLKRLVKQKQVSWNLIRERPIREHSLTVDERRVHVFTLISPSSAANRSIGNSESYKSLKNRNPNFSVLDFRIAQYKSVFLD